MKTLVVICLLTLPCLAFGSAIDEVNLFRTSHGLPAFRHDPELTKFAQMKAEYRAQRLLHNGHQGPANPPGTIEGTAEATPFWGWLSCCQEEDWRYAGAGIALGEDGDRYMVLIVRDGSGRATKGRSLRPISTAHLTPEVVHVSQSGERTLRTTGSGGGSRPAVSRTKKNPTAVKSGFVVGGKDKDGAVIISIGGKSIAF